MRTHTHQQICIKSHFSKSQAGEAGNNDGSVRLSIDRKPLGCKDHVAFHGHRLFAALEADQGREGAFKFSILVGKLDGSGILLERFGESRFQGELQGRLGVRICK